ncbi:MAG TPA: phosphoribosyltransferase family protein [Candidatus Saccharimonadales bacterium]|jgi:ComF family protein
MSILEYFVSILAPHTCMGCGNEGALLCANCGGGLRRAVARRYRCHKVTTLSQTCKSCRRQTKLTRVRALTTYEQSAKDLVWRLKFGRAKVGAAEIGRLLASLLSETAQSENLILVHVPTATSRVRRRGYDQAALITKALAREAGLPRASLLLRAGQQRQVGGSRAKRREQIKDAFRARKPRAIQNAYIVLIDDVVTTGATLEAAAATLKAAGAKKVEAVVFAQA